MGNTVGASILVIIIYQYTVSFVSDIQAGDGNIANNFFTVYSVETAYLIIHGFSLQCFSIIR